jgi:hypothetical protein
MPRSAGITISAVVVLIGSAFTILTGMVMMLGSLFMLNSTRANVPANFGTFAGIEAVILYGFGSWGIATGIGLVIRCHLHFQCG